MSNTVLIWLASLIALLVGVFCTLAVVRTERHHATPQVSPPAHDTGAQEILAALRQSYVVLDRDGDVLRANASAYSHGLVRSDASRNTRLAHPELIETVRQVRETGTPSDKRFTLNRGLSRQERSVFAISVSPLSADRLLLLADDLTREQRVEDTRRDFVVNVSHELKTPVGAMLLLAETLEQAADDPAAVRRFSARMTNEAHRLSSLVQEIIELSRVQASAALGRSETVRVTDFITDAVSRCQNLAQGRRITLATGVVPDVEVYGDAKLLATAVSNLVSNAVVYSAAGAKVGVGVRLAERDGVECVEVSVTDEGVGIGPDDLDRIFERFYRVDPARSRHTGGSGLGLAIVKHIAEDHGGVVTAWSEVGQGSTFTLRLPLAPPLDTVASGPITLVAPQRPLLEPPPSASERSNRIGTA